MGWFVMGWFVMGWRPVMGVVKRGVREGKGEGEGVSG